MLEKIISNLNYKNLSADEILNILNTKNILYLDKTPWTWAGIAKVVGNNGAESLRLALESHGMGWAVHQLGGSGLDLSIDDVQNALYQLESMGVYGMQNVATSVKRMQSVLEKYNIETDLIEVSEIINKLKLNDLKNKLFNDIMDRTQKYKEKVSVWDGNLETEPEF